MDLKRIAAEKAAEYIQSGQTLGLGTGTSSDEVLRRIHELMASKTLTDIRGIPTSKRTERLARELGIELCSFEEVDQIDLTIDGTDEFDDKLNLLKGQGGALTREKLVAQCSVDYVIVAEASKRVDNLGNRCTLPVEVLPFGWSKTASRIADLGADVQLRMSDEQPFSTDQDNYIVDCKFRSGIADPEKLASELKSICGIVEHGLFLGMAKRIVMVSESGVEILERQLA